MNVNLKQTLFVSRKVKLINCAKPHQHISCCIFFQVMASSAYTRDEAERKLRIAAKCNIAGVVVGLILTPLLIWYNIERMKRQQEEYGGY